DTRKLEKLIESRRPPRALPPDCPPALQAIIGTALAASLERRYATAAAFESDLRAFLEDRPTVAEAQREPSWISNETIEQSSLQPSIQSSQWKQKIVLHTEQATRFSSILLAGFVVGLILFIPAVYVFRLSEVGASLRAPRDFV